MNDRLTGMTALITGASSGIGKACVEAFAREGVKVILAARRTERLYELADVLDRDYSAKCLPLCIDVRDRGSIKSALTTLPEQFCNIDILVNNAGLARGLNPIHHGDHTDWDEMIDTNIKGLLNITREVTPGMVERGTGHIINIGSIAGRYVYPNGTVYCATKFAVRALNQGLMMELVDTPLRVSTVDPGLVETEFSLVRHRGDSENAGVPYENMTPLTAMDVADAVLFCATRSPHVNISEMVIMPTDQASPYHVHREE